MGAPVPYERLPAPTDLSRSNACKAADKRVHIRVHRAVPMRRIAFVYGR
jgi:hypothetical protein